MQGQRIGLLGGSFNPAHGGHRDISLAALAALNLDAVWWLVSPGNPLKDPASYAGYEERTKQAAHIASHSQIYISDFEKKSGTQYTIDTLTKLQSAYHETEFIWLMGADNLESFHLWRDWQAIFERIPIAVANRPGHEEAAIAGQAAQLYKSARVSIDEFCNTRPLQAPAWVFLPDTDNETSSTKIRARQKENAMTASALASQYGLQHFLDFNPPTGDFHRDVMEGLARPQKSLSPKYFYDEQGSNLFEDITAQKEYYPTRTELALLDQNLPAIVKAMGPQPAIFEYGSGASEKIRKLIDAIPALQAYVAMDISRDFLLSSAKTLAQAYPRLGVSAVCADFQQPITLPPTFHPQVTQWTGFFPGSTIGNFAPGTVQSFFERIAQTLGKGAQFLIGFDLIKDEAILNAAYNDKAGVTAAFNLNVLARMERELGANLVLDDFEHHAFYNSDEHRIEMHLRARRETAIRLDGQDFAFAKGETLHTEYSHKYSRELMETIIAKTPFSLSDYWTDEKEWFAMALLRSE